MSQAIYTVTWPPSRLPPTIAPSSRHIRGATAHRHGVAGRTRFDPGSDARSRVALGPRPARPGSGQTNRMLLEPGRTSGVASSPATRTGRPGEGSESRWRVAQVAPFRPSHSSPAGWARAHWHQEVARLLCVDGDALYLSPKCF
jgi:hypothetical protein